MDLAVDYSVFRSDSPESMLVEIYHSIPFQELRYEERNETLYGSYWVDFKVSDLAGRGIVAHGVFEPVVIPLSLEPAKHGLMVTHSFSLKLVPGKYVMVLQATDSGESGCVTETLAVRDLGRTPSLSDPYLGNSVVRTAGGMISVMPSAGRRFGARLGPEMYIYVEGYGFPVPSSRSETAFHYVATQVLNAAGQVVKEFPVEQASRVSDGLVAMYGVTTQGLKPGDYRLHIEVWDAKTGMKAASEKGFVVVGHAPSATAPMVDRG
ncbi:MAG: hypothetical protein ABIK62_07695, partial [candidate division WOR-3 bacterium]